MIIILILQIRKRRHRGKKKKATHQSHTARDLETYLALRLTSSEAVDRAPLGASTFLSVKWGNSGVLPP